MSGQCSGSDLDSVASSYIRDCSSINNTMLKNAAADKMDAILLPGFVAHRIDSGSSSSHYNDLICCPIAGTLFWLADFYSSLLLLADS